MLSFLQRPPGLGSCTRSLIYTDMKFGRGLTKPKGRFAGC
jgi:hypothetical protein